MNGDIHIKVNHDDGTVAVEREGAAIGASLRNDGGYVSMAVYPVPPDGKPGEWIDPYAEAEKAANLLAERHR